MVRHATIHGVVVDEHGIPVTAAGVRAFGPSAEEPVGRATADNAGRFLMRVPPGRYRLEISMPEGDSGDVLDGAWVVDARRETDPPLRIIVTRLR